MTLDLVMDDGAACAAGGPPGAQDVYTSSHAGGPFRAAGAFGTSPPAYRQGAQPTSHLQTLWLPPPQGGHAPWSGAWQALKGAVLCFFFGTGSGGSPGAAGAFLTHGWPSGAANGAPAGPRSNGGTVGGTTAVPSTTGPLAIPQRECAALPPLHPSGSSLHGFSPPAGARCHLIQSKILAGAGGAWHSCC